MKFGTKKETDNTNISEWFKNLAHTGEDTQMKGEVMMLWCAHVDEIKVCGGGRREVNEEGLLLWNKACIGYIQYIKKKL